MDNSEYITCKNKLDQLYDEKANGVGIKSKCDWYQYGEKSTKFFLNLEKIRPHQSKARNILKNRKAIIDQMEVNNQLFYFYNDLFRSDKRRPKHDIAQSLSSIQIPLLISRRTYLCITEYTKK